MNRTGRFRPIAAMGAIVLATVVVACSGSTTPPAATTAPNTPAASPPAAGMTAAPTSTPAAMSSVPTSSPAAAAAASLTLVTGSLGNFIADGKGRTLYLFTTDTATTSSCSGPCLDLWPPLLTTGTPTVGTGLDPAKVTTLTRSDGSNQVVYGSWPLYYYAPDTAAGETKGQGVAGKWYVVGADGQGIGRPAS